METLVSDWIMNRANTLSPNALRTNINTLSWIGLNSLTKEVLESFSCPFYRAMAQWEDGTHGPGIRSSPDTESACTFILGFQDFIIERNKCLYFISYLAYGMLLQQPACTNSLVCLLLFVLCSHSPLWLTCATTSLLAHYSTCILFL